MTQVQPLGPQADLTIPGQQPIPLGTIEAGHPVIATDGPRIPLKLHTIDGVVVDITVHDPAWIGELAYEVRVMQDRARGVFEGSSK